MEKRKDVAEMKPYRELTRGELLALKDELEAKYREFQGRNFKIRYVQRKTEQSTAGSFDGNDGCFAQRC